jgi:hypothetical protein
VRSILTNGGETQHSRRGRKDTFGRHQQEEEEIGKENQTTEINKNCQQIFWPKGAGQVEQTQTGAVNWVSIKVRVGHPEKAQVE